MPTITRVPRNPTTPIDVDLIARTLRDVALTTGHLTTFLPLDPYPDTPPIACTSVARCAIGELLFKAGMTDSQLARIGDDPSDWAHVACGDCDDCNVGMDDCCVNATSAPAEILLFTTYGLTVRNANDIINANDYESEARSAPDNDPTRYERVIECVRQLADVRNAYIRSATNAR